MQPRILASMFKLLSLLALVTGLTACGGSSGDSDSTYTYAYLQFYNASPNGATVIMREVDGDALGSAQFGDSTSLISTDTGELELEFIRTDSDDQEVLIDTMTVNMEQGQKKLIVLSGDFSAPELLEYQFERETLEDHFRLFVAGLLVDGSEYDFYLSEEGDPFEAANFLGTISYQTLSEMTFWAGDSDSDDFDSGKYTIYLTKPGETEVVFESQTIDFAYDTEYVLTLRDVSGAIQTGLSVDAILNSSYVTNITDVDAESQYRIYNSTELDQPLTVTFGGNDGEEDITYTLSSGEMSDFTEIRYGDYRVSVSAGDGSVTPLSNKLMTLNQGESKAIMIYNNNNALGAASFIESGLPQAYDKTVNFINLVSDFDNIDFYLVRKDETIDTALYYALNMEFGENSVVVLPADYYEVIAVYEDDNEEQVLLDRTALTGLTEDENYIITVEPADNATGYEVNVLY
ncbi:DUF4397 domain-containing protein [Alteromonas pelagimontana]|uniref:DUF4397 domain-containing protein n=1 Tax=Alteromonas pelagimontana TaxID=1858656 RepID=A0A6M4MEI3_9ALTE|nr:DUF4397 domain-containing protein [Alteromonas pelagimontana]QJR81509.1 DUF4397 domain-containing protein [Alteromonas pelagimontana]